MGTDATAMSTPEKPTVPTSEPSWSDRYGAKHRWRPFVSFPAGLGAPKKVRLYQRAAHFLLNWWDPGEKKNRSERAGDPLAALTRARDIDQRIGAVSTAGVPGAGGTRAP